MPRAITPLSPHRVSCPPGPPANTIVPSGSHPNATTAPGTALLGGVGDIAMGSPAFHCRTSPPSLTLSGCPPGTVSPTHRSECHPTIRGGAVSLRCHTLVLPSLPVTATTARGAPGGAMQAAVGPSRWIRWGIWGRPQRSQTHTQPHTDSATSDGPCPPTAHGGDLSPPSSRSRCPTATSHSTTAPSTDPESSRAPAHPTAQTHSLWAFSHRCSCCPIAAPDAPHTATARSRPPVANRVSVGQKLRADVGPRWGYRTRPPPPKPPGCPIAPWGRTASKGNSSTAPSSVLTAIPLAVATSASTAPLPIGRCQRGRGLRWAGPGSSQPHRAPSGPAPASTAPPTQARHVIGPWERHSRGAEPHGVPCTAQTPP